VRGHEPAHIERREWPRLFAAGGRGARSSGREHLVERGRRVLGAAERHARLGELAQRPIRKEEGHGERSEAGCVRRSVGRESEQPGRDGDHAEELVGSGVRRRPRVDARAPIARLSPEVVDDGADGSFGAVRTPEIGVAHGLVCGFEERLGLGALGALRSLDARANAAEEPTERRQHDDGDPKETRRGEDEHQAQEHDLHGGPGGVHPRLQAERHLAHPTGQRGDRARVCTGFLTRAPMIGVSWMAQTMNSEKGVEHVAAEGRAHIAYHSRRDPGAQCAADESRERSADREGREGYGIEAHPARGSEMHR